MPHQGQLMQPLGDHPDVVVCAEAFAECISSNDLDGALRCIRRGEMVAGLIDMARR